MQESANSEGIDRKQLAVLRKRFLRINRQRLMRMRGAMPEHQRDFADIVCLALHQNHPILPGYINKEVPSGISDYTPGQPAIRAAKRHAKSFVLKKRAHLKREILSLFIMGSSGTVAHSGESDYDIWVCHRRDLSAEGRALLRRKLDLISQWSHTLGLDAHFFLMDEDYFTQNKSAPMDKEAAGSSQHYLLLDEFYRTAIILAGRAPLWWMVPDEQNEFYQEYAKTLLEKRYLRATDWIDFGHVPELPVNEFFGAALWQVYKGIDAPYKSVLKIILMEVYASMYPDILPLSSDYKRHVYLEDSDPSVVDPYLMVYRKVEAYLLKRKEYERLDLIRRCFYIKVNIKVSQSVTHDSVSWRRELMTRLCRQWGWEQDRLLQLDNRKHWKVNRAKKERRDLVSELTNSYKFLSNFGRQHSSLTRITEHDITLLGRKLYAAFERRSGKIESINPNIAPNLGEELLTLHRHRSSSSLNSWLLYKARVSADDAKFHTPVKRSTNLVELVAWAYINGLMTKTTQVFLNPADEQLSERELQQLCRGMIQHFPIASIKPNNHAFEQPAYLLYQLLIVNLGVDPMA
ncbi:MAG: class I adenylate cyclase, partial [Gammaproteobacteria bacterium]|nr:class I adenylate cyclase [Gammaproteobacteria bacterium]